MPRFALVLLVLCTGCVQPHADSEPSTTENKQAELLQTERFVFEVDGHKLVGLLDMPIAHEPVSTIIIVHGYGATNVVEQNWFYSLRSRFAAIGINTLVWDKPGCGESEGEFDINQPVGSSAKEVVAAVRALQQRPIKGSDTIGLWGISRAGWIAPLAIDQEDAIDFWISVSGTDDKENARYLLESNWRIEGRTETEVQQLISEWQAQFNAAWQNGTYEQYLYATPTLNDDSFIQFMGWGGTASEEEFLAYQRKFQTGEFSVDEEEELMVHVPEFKRVLSSIDMPVLAMFGEKDTNVDWRKTIALYEETIGANPGASLHTVTFPEANHILKASETGGIREMNSMPGNTPYVDGYYETMISWLLEHGFGN